MKFRLLSAHYLDGDYHLLGDKEMEQDHGPEKGTIVGDGTPYKVRTPTLEMAPLDDEAEDALEVERKRLAAYRGSMDPVAQLPMNFVPDDYERRYLPGFAGVPRPQGA